MDMTGTVRATRPAAISDCIRKLCAKLDPSQTPRFVPVAPESYCHELNCFFNVPKKIERDGGRIQVGWTIWELKNVMLDAEFHAVWVSPEGREIDVTPHPDGERMILFQPDTRRTYHFKPIESVRVALQDHPAILEFIRISSRIYQLQDEHTVGPATAEGVRYAMPRAVYREMEDLESRREALFPELQQLVRGL